MGLIKYCRGLPAVFIKHYRLFRDHLCRHHQSLKWQKCWWCVDMETSVTRRTLDCQNLCVHSSVTLVARRYCGTSASLIGCLHLWSVNVATLWSRVWGSACECNCLVLLFLCCVTWHVGNILLMLIQFTLLKFWRLALCGLIYLMYVSPRHR
jgi:hypothetical protein